MFDVSVPYIACQVTCNTCVCFLFWTSLVYHAHLYHRSESSEPMWEVLCVVLSHSFSSMKRQLFSNLPLTSFAHSVMYNPNSCRQFKQWFVNCCFWIWYLYVKCFPLRFWLSFHVLLYMMLIDLVDVSSVAMSLCGWFPLLSFLSRHFFDFLNVLFQSLNEKPIVSNFCMSWYLTQVYILQEQCLKVTENLET